MAVRVEIEAEAAAVEGRERCAGLDVHRSTIVVCATAPVGGGRLKKVWNEFPTISAGLVRLVEWLAELGVTHDRGSKPTGYFFWDFFHGPLATLPDRRACVMG